MVGEKANSRSPENMSENSDAFGENSKYPPFDPEKAKELVAQARILRSAEQISDGEYDFRNVDRYQETTFLLAAADSLADSPDTAYIDSIAFKIGDKVTKNKTSVFEALKQSVKESDTDEKGGFAATDLLGAFIDTTSTYVVSKDEKIGRGFAKGLLTNLEMRIDGFATDKPNPYLDALRVDLSIIKPLADEFIKSYDASYDKPDAFRDYLKLELEMQEIDIRSAKRRGEQVLPDVERTAQAIKSAMTILEEMQWSYNNNLKNLRDTAYANHRVIK